MKRIATFKNRLGELEVRYTRTDTVTESLKSSRQVFEFIKEFMPDYWNNRHDHEQFHVICFNNSMEPVHTFLVSQGGESATTVDPKILFRNALVAKCVGIILTHNHPSCRVRPSGNDIHLTKKLVKAGELLDIKVLDHIIIGGDQYYSFKDEGEF